MKLLRAVQERAILPLGETKPVPVDVRLVAATHRNLALEVQAGRFREDLFYRLAVAVLHLPALRERQGDLGPLGDGDFFVELLPRKRRVLVLLNLELGECEYRDDRVRDATDYRWVANATNSGGVFYDLTNVAQLDAAMKLVRQAYALAAQ